MVARIAEAYPDAPIYTSLFDRAELGAWFDLAPRAHVSLQRILGFTRRFRAMPRIHPYARIDCTSVTSNQKARKPMIDSIGRLDKRAAHRSGRYLASHRSGRYLASHRTSQAQVLLLRIASVPMPARNDPVGGALVATRFGVLEDRAG